MVNKKWEGIERRQNDKLSVTVAEIHELVDEIKLAFPGGDLDGHRRAHESMIKAAEAEAQFYNSLKLEIAKKAVWGGLILLLSLAALGLYVKIVGPR